MNAGVRLGTSAHMSVLIISRPARNHNFYIRRMLTMNFQVTGILGLLWLVVVIWAIIQVAQSSASGMTKLLWIVLMLFLPVIGVILWLLLGPKSGR
jgi:hypothetical protein